MRLRNPVLILWHGSVMVFGFVVTVLILPMLSGMGAVLMLVFAERNRRGKVRRYRYSWAVDDKHTSRSAYKRARYGRG